MEKKRRGLKRHKALRPLSHHHNQALFVALKLKRVGTEKSRFSVEEVREEVQLFWEPGGREHFREEEEILLTTYAQYASIDDKQISDMLLEHVKIGALMNKLLKADDDDPFELMHELGTLLETHIRKEERIIFPMIERALPEDKMNELAPYLHVN
ncbi:hemerythrin domain-containing protein [Aquibacillus sp. 3ASR75-11]|uniref:Hemerythrin domain-containing protein n=1 Tax=Terrihalobacillus insolitus TaxID=2950438 RepID=A0A9X3WXJ5_9BACI|nr:hemerythrin domain-containing protein [Terrihalobacillus insolitus]MDC3413506.1 hemerythrin domain-containing protein [Terrihalobacillus insolitus]MDC3425204.1 hemerythrin domain-containing protein [Terrihalobacillus insolitus]